MKLLVHDVDAHEMIPSHLLAEAFGEPGRMMGELFARASVLHPDPTATNMHQPDAFDTVAIDPANIWKVKGAPAPSANLKLRPHKEFVERTWAVVRATAASGVRYSETRT